MINYLLEQFPLLVAFHQAGGNMIYNKAIDDYVTGWLSERLGHGNR